MKRSTLALAFLCVAIAAGSGCAYFRWGDPSYQEIQQRTEEQKAAEPATLNPGTAFKK